MIMRAQIVAEARSWLGTPYRHRASLKGVGVDCLGLIRGVWRTFYGDEPEILPPYSGDWAEATGQETMLRAGERHLVSNDSEIKAGDVLVFRWQKGVPAKHAGIVTGSNHFTHAYERSYVVETTLTPWWRNRIAGVFSFPEVAD